MTKTIAYTQTYAQKSRKNDFVRAETIEMETSDIHTELKRKVDKKRLGERVYNLLGLFIKTRDRKFFRLFTGSLQNYVNLVDEPDRDEYLNKRAHEFRITRTQEHEDLGLTPSLLAELE